MRPSTSDFVLARLVTVRDALDITRLEMQDARSRATKTREIARRLRTEAEQLRRAARVSFRATPSAQHR